MSMFRTFMIVAPARDPALSILWDKVVISPSAGAVLSIQSLMWDKQYLFDLERGLFRQVMYVQYKYKTCLSCPQNHPLPPFAVLCHSSLLYHLHRTRLLVTNVCSNERVSTEKRPELYGRWKCDATRWSKTRWGFECLSSNSLSTGTHTEKYQASPLALCLQIVQN